MRIAVFPGSFDPITLGHLDIIKRASPLFDKIIVAIGVNSQKKYMFSLEQRADWIKRSVEQLPNVEVDTFSGLTIDYCKQKDANFILRGLRNPTDFEFEKSIGETNRKLSGVETVFLITSDNLSSISSSIVREVIRHDGDYTILVPDTVRV